MQLILTILLYTIAIIDCLTDRLLWPFLQSLFIELTTDQAPKLALVTTSATTAVTTADTSVSTTVTEAPIKLRASRKRRQTATETVG